MLKESIIRESIAHYMGKNQSYELGTLAELVLESPL